MEKYIISEKLKSFLSERGRLSDFENELSRQEDKDLLLSEYPVVATISSHILWEKALNQHLWPELHREFSKSYEPDKMLNYGELSRVLIGGKSRTVIRREQIGLKHAQAVRELRNLILIWWQKWHKKQE